jgi:hypothetical protein
MINPKILKMISREGKNGYYCPICQHELSVSEMSLLCCYDEKKWPRHGLVINDLGYTLWAYMSRGTNYCYIRFSSGATRIQISSISYFKTLLNLTIDSFLEFQDMSSLEDQINTYLLFS